MMRESLLGSVIAVLVVAGGGDIGMTQGPNVESELRDLEQKLAQAWVTRDRAFIVGLLSADWTVTDPSGRILTREQVLTETFSTAERKIESMAVDDVRVRRLGLVAVVTGRTRATGSYQGERATVALRFTDVFRYQEGRWQVVASHGTMIAP